jgi:hypothetical protein
MRTLLPEELKEEPLVKLAVGFTLILMLGFVVTGFLLYFQHMDLSASSVVSYYAGSEQEYRPARTVESMLGVTHAHAVVMGAALLLLSLLLIRSPLSSGTKKAFIVLPFLAAILSESASWLIWSGVPAFAWVKIASFLTLQISLVAVVILLAVASFRSARKPEESVLGQRAPAPPVQRGGPPSQQRQHPQQQSQQGDFHRRRRRPRRRRGGGSGGGRPGTPGPQQGPPTPPASM